MGSRGLERWLSSVAAPLALDGRGSLEPFAPLDGAAARARVAYIVESHHFVHEKYAFRLLMLRYLAARGWRRFGEELGWADGQCIDEHLRTGDAAVLDRVPTYGYEGVRRADRDDRPWGILKQGDDAYPLGALRHEQCAFARDVRQAIPGARWFGFDATGGPPPAMRSSTGTPSSRRCRGSRSRKRRRALRASLGRGRHAR